MEKKRIRIITLLVCLVVMLTAFTACDFNSGTAAIKAGKWEEDVFTNNWSGIKVTLPDGYTSLSKVEMEQLFAQGEEIIVNDPGLSDIEIDKIKTKVLYEFMIKFPDQKTNISLSYENMSYAGKIISEKMYLDKLKEEFSKITQMKYTFLNSGKEEIAGKNYTAANFSLNSGAAFQTIYLRKIDDVMILIIATYFEDSQDQVKDFIKSIEKA